MRVHHKNLTTLVGYCYEGTNMGLVYEYMANGDLEAHLSGLVIIEVSSKDPKFLAHQFFFFDKPEILFNKKQATQTEKEPQL